MKFITHISTIVALSVNIALAGGALLDGVNLDKPLINNVPHNAYIGGKKVWSDAIPVKQWALVFTGTQWIDTGIVANSDMRIVVDCVIDESSSGWAYIYGVRKIYQNITSSIGVGLYPHIANGMLFEYDGRTSFDFPERFGSRLIIDKSKNTLYINGIQVANLPPSEFDTNVSTYLGTMNDAGSTNFLYHFSGLIRGYKMYDSNNNILCDYIPVPLGSTKFSTTPAPSNCMFDAVTQQYFENKGTGVFGIIEEVTP